MPSGEPEKGVGCGRKAQGVVAMEPQAISFPSPAAGHAISVFPLVGWTGSDGRREADARPQETVSIINEPLFI